MNLAPARTLDAAWVLARRCNMLLREGPPEGLRQLSWVRPTRMGAGPGATRAPG
jgi:hypothetical protein